MHYLKRTLSAVPKLFWATGLSLGVVASACAANWPTKTVTIVVPFSAGGTTDVVARLMADKLGQMWRQSVVVENKLGAGGNVGTSAVSRATPDGYTLLMASGSILTVSPHLYKDLPFNIKKDFIPITNIATGPMVIVTSNKIPAKNLKDFIAHAKKNPQQVNMGSAGLASQVHMAGENFMYAADIKMTHVPYRGEAATYTDLMAGQIDVVVGNIGAVSSLVDSGRVKALAVTSDKRAPMLPNIPTAKEAGLDFTNYGWFGFVAPAGTPQSVVDKIQADTAKVLAMPEVQTRLEQMGMTAVGNTSAEFVKAIDQESQHWAKVIKDRNITIQ